MSSGQTKTQTRERMPMGGQQQQHQQQRTPLAQMETDAAVVVHLRRNRTIIKEQSEKLGLWNDVGRKIIKEICGFREEDLEEDITPEDLAMVIDYLKLMKSSVQMYQDVNEALRSRVDELVQISENDGRWLGNVVDYIRAMPVLDILGASRDRHDNHLILDVSLEGAQAVQLRALDMLDSTQQPALSSSSALTDSSCCVAAAATTEVEPMRSSKKRNWIGRILSTAACLLVGTVVAKSSFGKCVASHA